MPPARSTERCEWKKVIVVLKCHSERVVINSTTSPGAPAAVTDNGRDKEVFVKLNNE